MTSSLFKNEKLENYANNTLLADYSSVPHMVKLVENTTNLRDT